jgi:hypothetical protein
MNETQVEVDNVKMIEDIIGKSTEIVNEKLDSEYYLEYQVDSVDIDENGKARIKVTFYYGRKLYEISEAVYERFENYVVTLEEELGRELSEEEVEEEWLRLYNDQLEEINAEYAIEAIGEIKTSFMTYGELHVKFYPLYCTEDYCLAGLEISVEISGLHVDIIRANKELCAELLATVLLHVIDLATL